MEQLSPDPLEDAAVLDDIRHPGGRTQVVLQNVEVAGFIAHQVATNNMRVHAHRYIQTAHFATVAARAEHQLRRDDAGTQNATFMINVVQEQVERAYTLLEAALDRAPFARGDQARDQVERHDLVRALRALVDGERHAARRKRQVGGCLSALDILRTERRQRVGQGRIVRPHPVGRLEHLIPEGIGIVGEGAHRGSGHAAAPFSASDGRTWMSSACLLQCNRPVAAPVNTPEVIVTSAKSRPTATVR